jgi:hypothetical protein
MKLERSLHDVARRVAPSCALVGVLGLRVFRFCNVSWWWLGLGPWSWARVMTVGGRTCMCMIVHGLACEAV